MLPTFQDCMLPILNYLADEKVHHTKDIHNCLKDYFHVTDEEESVLLPSKRTTRFKCNLSWARTYMKAAGLIKAPQRSSFQITQEGKRLLKTNPERVNVEILSQYEKFNQWNKGYKPKKTSKEENEKVSSLTPEEQIQESYQMLRNSLAQDLLDNILENSPEFFEHLVIRLLVAMGYGGSYNEISEMVVGKNGDEGIDGIIKEDKLGLDSIYVQAKRWKKDKTIGRPDIQTFVGALSGQGAFKGIFITTARFTEQARNFKPHNNIKVALIDGETLCQHMIDYNIGVSVQETFEVKRIDSDFFIESEME